MQDREQLTSKIAFQVVSGLSDVEIMQHHNISQLKLKRIMNSGDFEILSKAYIHLASVGKGDVSDTLSVKQAIGTIALSFLNKSKEKMRPRKDVIELLDTILDSEIDSNVFLQEYEKQNGVYWQ